MQNFNLKVQYIYKTLHTNTWNNEDSLLNCSAKHVTYVISQTKDSVHQKWNLLFNDNLNATNLLVMFLLKMTKIIGHKLIYQIFILYNYLLEYYSEVLFPTILIKNVNVKKQV